jgi:hypothetical protein
MRSSILAISTAALLLGGAVSARASTAATQWDPRSPYQYEQWRDHDQRRDEFGERRAFENGRRDGYSKGFDDMRHHRRPDVYRQKWFRNGDHNYDRAYGPRDEYRNGYRRGFELGYERAYREGWEGWQR